MRAHIYVWDKDNGVMERVTSNPTRFPNLKPEPELNNFIFHGGMVYHIMATVFPSGTNSPLGLVCRPGHAESDVLNYLSRAAAGE